MHTGPFYVTPYRRTERQTDIVPLLYALRYGRSQRDNSANFCNVGSSKLKEMKERLCLLSNTIACVTNSHTAVGGVYWLAAFGP